MQSLPPYQPCARVGVRAHVQQLRHLGRITTLGCHQQTLLHSMLFRIPEAQEAVRMRGRLRGHDQQATATQTTCAHF